MVEASTLCQTALGESSCRSRLRTALPAKPKGRDAMSPPLRRVGCSAGLRLQHRLASGPSSPLTR